jgi:spore coat protein CotF
MTSASRSTSAAINATFAKTNPKVGRVLREALKLLSMLQLEKANPKVRPVLREAIKLLQLLHVEKTNPKV